MNDFNTWQMIVHWVVTCAAWGFGALLVVKECRKKSGVDLLENIRKIPVITKDNKVWQWILIVLGAVMCLVSTWIDWNGSKVLSEFKSRGPILFPFQYIYYLFEVMLVLLTNKIHQIWCIVQLKKNRLQKVLIGWMIF